MGQAKRALDDGVYGCSGRPDLYVCPGCVTEDFLQNELRRALMGEECSYCGAPQAAPFDHLVELLSDAVDFYCEDAAALPFDSREGGCIGGTFDATELLHDEFNDWTENYDLLHDVADCFPDRLWCMQNWSALSMREALMCGWDEFSRQVKHSTRFLFFPRLAPGEFHSEVTDGILPGDVLDALGELFLKHQLFRTLDAGSRFHRARVVRRGERPSLPSELGAPPCDAAIYPNRMSPAGISMFYAAFDRATALLETYEPRRSRNREIAVAEFVCLRPLHVLDLSRLPSVPSPYDALNRSQRDSIQFLRDFERDFTQPVERDGRAHAEYAPTQVITEYVRHRLTTSEGNSVDGIVYRSARNPASQAVVVFAGPEHCGPLAVQHPRRPEPFLSLARVEYLGPPFRRHTRGAQRG